MSWAGKLGLAAGAAVAAEDTCRFQPVTLNLSGTMIQGVSERMTLTNLERMMVFYAPLIVTAAR